LLPNQPTDAAIPPQTAAVACYRGDSTGTAHPDEHTVPVISGGEVAVCVTDENLDIPDTQRGHADRLDTVSVLITPESRQRREYGLFDRRARETGDQGVSGVPGGLTGGPPRCPPTIPCSAGYRPPLSLRQQ
jgi:hypothetical protein